MNAVIAPTCISTILIGAACLAPSLASAETTGGVSLQANIDEAEEDDRQPWLGLVLDAGLPDGANVGAVFRPLPWLRTHLSGSYNLASFGIRGGVSYVPFDYWVVPTATVEGGHFFAGDPESVASDLAGVDVDYVPDSISYSYANLHLGAEFGTDWFTIFLRGGYSYVHATIDPPDVSEDGVRFEEDVTLTAWTPSVKLGLIVYVY